MIAKKLEISGLVLFEPRVHQDERGLFFECFNQRLFESIVGDRYRFVQDNQSMSKKGVVRGLHYQEAPYSQGKLVRVISGEIYDVAVDLRNGSETFGRWVGVTLSSMNRKQLWLPPGFAHGFCATKDNTEVHYKVTEFYDPNSERSIIWNDPELAITWPKETEYLVSKKDQQAPRFNPSDFNHRY